MKLIVNNLGAVRHAEVDLSKDLLLFTGANNTGKTYLAYVVYNLFSKVIIQENEDYIFIPKNKNGNYEIDINLNEGVEKFKEIFNKVMVKSLSKLFSNDSKSWQNTSFDIVIDNNDLENLYESSWGFSVESESISLNQVLGKKKNSYLFSIKSGESEIGYATIFDAYLIGFLDITGVHLFTDERSAINLFTKELSLTRSRFLTTLLNTPKAKDMLGLVSDRINRYSLPIRDSLQEVELYDSKRKLNSDFAHLAAEIEAQFLSGKVSVTEGGDLQFSLDGNGKILEIHTTSSTVKSLSPIVFYLRHQAQKGDFIIIGEPELNLHPDNQRKIAKFFGRLINEGFKVLISTHSDYIVRELNNLIMLGSGLQTKPEETHALMKTYGYAENELLKKEQIAPYLFRVGKDVAEIPVTETGFSVETIDEEAQKINQSSQNIYFTLFDE